MADEAYRAVFLRVHPTGKMVLSLTTESDGEEARYAQLVAGELGVPALDVKVVPADDGPVRRRPRLQHEPVGADAGGDRRAPPARSWPRPSCSPAPRSRRPPDSLTWENGAFVSSADPSQAKTIADVALYAHGSGALPPGVEGGLDAQTVYKEGSN